MDNVFLLHGFNSFSNMVQAEIGFAVLILLINIPASSTISSHSLNPFPLSVYFRINWKCLIFTSKSILFYTASFMSWDSVLHIYFFFLFLSLLFFLWVVRFVVVFSAPGITAIFKDLLLFFKSTIKLLYLHTGTIGGKIKIVTVIKDFWEKWSLNWLRCRLMYVM